MPTDATLNDLEHIARVVREATDMDAVDRALCNYIAHDLATRIEARNLFVTVADVEDVDRLAAELDATRVQLGTVKAQFTDVEANIVHRYDLGYHAGVQDDPAPMSDDIWFKRGLRAGQSECDAVNLRQDCEELKRKLADAEATLEEARTGVDDTINEAWRAGFESGRKGDPDPSIESWFGRGWRDATRARRILDLEQDRERLIAQTVENDRKINQLSADITSMTDSIAVWANLNAELERQLAEARACATFETGTQNQPIVAVAILDATPAELAAVVTSHNGSEPALAANDTTTPRSSGFRFSGTDDELRTRTIAAIQQLAQANAGQAPTINDWDLSCRAFGLPTAAGIQGRLDTTWDKLVVEAGFKPNRGRK